MKWQLAMLGGAVLLAGCGTAPAPLLKEAPSVVLTSPPPDKAQIVFLEPINSIQGAFATGLYEIKGDERTLLAMTAAHSKTVQLVSPGHHLFMSNAAGGISHLMAADVEAGKRYYVLLRFIYAQGFQLRPIRPTGDSDYSARNKDFKSWLSSTHFVEMTPDAQAWYTKYKENVDKAQAIAVDAWSTKTREQQAELTLNAADAIAD